MSVYREIVLANRHDGKVPEPTENKKMFLHHCLAYNQKACCHTSFNPDFFIMLTTLTQIQVKELRTISNKK